MKSHLEEKLEKYRGWLEQLQESAGARARSR
jgi:hypothetical protein